MCCASPFKHKIYKSLEIRALEPLLRPPKTTTNWSIITAVCANRGSKCFLIFLPAEDPWIFKPGDNSNQIYRKVSKIQTSDKDSFGIWLDCDDFAG